MKKRRIVVLAFLLFACLSLGIGYAALTDSFTVTGDLGANVDNSNLVVVFDGETESTTEVSTVDGTHCNFATANGASGLDGKTVAELTISGLTTKGDQAWAKLVVVNRSTAAKADELNATLSAPTVNYKDLDQGMFEITATWQTTTGTTPDDQVLEINEAMVVYILIELLETPTNSVTAKSFEVTFTATTN